MKVDDVNNVTVNTTVTAVTVLYFLTVQLKGGLHVKYLLCFGYFQKKIGLNLYFLTLSQKSGTECLKIVN